MADRITEPLFSGPVVPYVALISAVLFLTLTAMVLAHETTGLDHDLIVSLRGGASPALTALLLAVTFTSGRLAVPAVILLAIAIYRRCGVRTCAYYVGACATAQLLNALLKYGVDRVRPHGVSPLLTAAGGLSYPSADVMLAVVIFGMGAVMLGWTTRAMVLRIAAVSSAVLFVCAAAVARVYLGAHWPTDVLGGALAGVACAACFMVVLHRPPTIPIPVTLIVQEL